MPSISCSSHDHNPTAYVLLLVPYSVTRLLMLAGYTVAFPAIIFAFGCWYTLGLWGSNLMAQR